jgi:hypothetical protein
MAPLGATLATVLLLQAAASEFQFPTYPIGPQRVALGGGGSVLSLDAEAGLNPAALGDGPRASLHRFAGYAGYGGTLLAGVLRAQSGHAVGVAVRRFAWDRVIEDDLGPGTADLEVSQTQVSISGAAKLTSHVRLGATLSRLIANNLGVITAGSSYSIGAIIQASWGGRLGLALRNEGRAVLPISGDVRYPLPTRLRIGAAQGVSFFGRRLTLATDFETRVRESTDPAVHIGAECWLSPVVALRSGYEDAASVDSPGRWESRLSAGLGVRLKVLDLGFAARSGGAIQGYELFLGIDAFR